MEHEGEGAGASSVDDVHAAVDGLVLSVFEAVVGHEAVTAEETDEGREAVTAAKCQSIADKLAAAQSAVERLTGVRRTQAEQEAEILKLSEECKAARNRILQREAQLVQRRGEIDAAIKSLLSDKALGLT